MNKKLVSIICAATLFSQTLPVDTIAKTIKESVINSDKSQVDAEEKNKEEDDSSTDEVKKNEKTESKEELGLDKVTFNAYIDKTNELLFSIGFDEKEKKFAVSEQSEKNISEEAPEETMYRIKIFDKEQKEKFSVELKGKDTGNSEKLEPLKSLNYEVGDFIQITPTDSKDVLKITGNIQGDVDKQKEDYSDGIDNYDYIGNVRFQVEEDHLKTVYNEAPVINGLTDIEESENPTNDILTGISIKDDHDGDIDNSKIVPLITELEDGVLDVSYTVEDSWGRKATGKRKILPKKVEQEEVKQEEVKQEEPQIIREEINLRTASTNNSTSQATTGLAANEITVEGTPYFNGQKTRFLIRFDTTAKQIQIADQDGRKLSNTGDSEYFKFVLYDKDMNEKASVSLLGNDKSDSDKLDKIANQLYEEGDYIGIWHAETEQGTSDTSQDSNIVKPKLKIGGNISVYQKTNNSTQNRISSTTKDYSNGMDNQDISSRRFKITATGLQEVTNDAPTIENLEEKSISRGESFDPLYGIKEKITDDFDKFDADNLDTKAVSITYTSYDVKKVGEQTITYTATDKWGKSSTTTRKLTVTSTNPMDAKYIEFKNGNQSLFKIKFDPVEKKFLVDNLEGVQDTPIDSAVSSSIFKLKIYTKGGVLQKTLNIKGTDNLKAVLKKFNGYNYNTTDYIEVWSNTPKNVIIHGVDRDANITKIQQQPSSGGNASGEKQDSSDYENYENGIDNTDFMKNVRFEIGETTLKYIYNKAPEFKISDDVNLEFDRNENLTEEQLKKKLMTGLTVEDDHDKGEDLIKKVIVGKLDLTTVGEKEVEYRVVDSWGRSSLIKRKVTVYPQSSLEYNYITIKNNETDDPILTIRFDDKTKKFVVDKIDISKIPSSLKNEDKVFELKLIKKKNTNNITKTSDENQVAEETKTITLTKGNLMDGTEVNKINELSYEEDDYLALWSYDSKDGIFIAAKAHILLNGFESNEKMVNTRFKVKPSGLENIYNESPTITGLDQTLYIYKNDDITQEIATKGLEIHDDTGTISIDSIEITDEDGRKLNPKDEESNKTKRKFKSSTNDEEDEYVETDEVKEFTLLYKVTDAWGKSATYKRTVSVISRSVSNDIEFYNENGSENLFSLKYNPISNTFDVSKKANNSASTGSENTTPPTDEIPSEPQYPSERTDTSIQSNSEKEDNQRTENTPNEDSDSSQGEDSSGGSSSSEENNQQSEAKVFKFCIFNAQEQKVKEIELTEEEASNIEKVKEKLKDVIIYDDYYISVWSSKVSRIKIKGEVIDNDKLGESGKEKQDYSQTITNSDYIDNVRFNLTENGIHAIYNKAPKITVTSKEMLTAYAGDIIDYTKNIEVKDDRDNEENGHIIDNSKIKVTIIPKEVNGEDQPIEGEGSSTGEASDNRDNISGEGSNSNEGSSDARVDTYTQEKSSTKTEEKAFRKEEEKHLKIGKNTIRLIVEDSWGRATSIERNLLILNGIDKNRISFNDGNGEVIGIGFNHQNNKLDVKTYNRSFGSSNTSGYVSIAVYRPSKNGGEPTAIVPKIEINNRDPVSNTTLQNLINYNFEYGDYFEIYHGHPTRFSITGNVTDERENYTDGVQNPENLLNVKFVITESGLKSVYTNPDENKVTNNKVVFGPVAPEKFPFKIQIDFQQKKFKVIETTYTNILNGHSDAVYKMVLIGSNGTIKRETEFLGSEDGNIVMNTTNTGSVSNKNWNNQPFEYDDCLYIWHKQPERSIIKGTISKQREDYSDGVNDPDNMNHVVFRLTETGLKSVYNNAPEIKGIEDVDVYQNQQFDTSANVTYKDDHDNENLTTNISPAIIDTSRLGEQTVTYTATDRWGKTTTVERKVTVRPNLYKNVFKIYPEIGAIQGTTKNGESADGDTLESTTLSETPSTSDTSNSTSTVTKPWDYVENNTRNLAFEIGFDTLTNKYKVYNQTDEKLSNNNLNDVAFTIKIKDANGNEKANITLTGNDRGTSPKLLELNNVTYADDDIIRVYRSDLKGIKITGDINGHIPTVEQMQSENNRFDYMQNTGFKVSNSGLQAIYNKAPVMTGVKKIRTISKGIVDLLDGITLSDDIDNDSISTDYIYIYIDDKLIGTVGHDNSQSYRSYNFDKVGTYKVKYLLYDKWERATVIETTVKVESKVRENEIEVYGPNNLASSENPEFRVAFDTKDNKFVLKGASDDGIVKKEEKEDAEEVKNQESNSNQNNNQESNIEELILTRVGEDNYFEMIVRNIKGEEKVKVSLNGDTEHDKFELNKLHNLALSKYDTISLKSKYHNAVKIKGNVITEDSNGSTIINNSYENGFGTTDKYTQVRFKITDDGLKEMTSKELTAFGIIDKAIKRGDTLDLLEGISVNVNDQNNEDYKITVKEVTPSNSTRVADNETVEDDNSSDDGSQENNTKTENSTTFKKLKEGIYTVKYTITNSWGTSIEKTRRIKVDPRTDLEAVKLSVKDRENNVILVIGFDSIEKKLRVIESKNKSINYLDNNQVFEINAFDSLGKTLGTIALRGSQEIEQTIIDRINNFPYEEGYALSIWAKSPQTTLQLEGNVENDKDNDFTELVPQNIFKSGLTPEEIKIKKMENGRFEILSSGLKYIYNNAPKFEGNTDVVIPYYKGDLLKAPSNLIIKDDHDGEISTTEVTVNDDNVDYDKLGEQQITYVVEDSWGRRAEKDGKIEIKSAMDSNSINIYPKENSTTDESSSETKQEPSISMPEQNGDENSSQTRTIDNEDDSENAETGGNGENANPNPGDGDLGSTPEENETAPGEDGSTNNPGSNEGESQPSPGEGNTPDSGSNGSSENNTDNEVVKKSSFSIKFVREGNKNRIKVETGDQSSKQFDSSKPNEIFVKIKIYDADGTVLKSINILGSDTGEKAKEKIENELNKSNSGVEEETEKSQIKTNEDSQEREDNTDSSTSENKQQFEYFNNQYIAIEGVTEETKNYVKIQGTVVNKEIDYNTGVSNIDKIENVRFKFTDLGLEAVYNKAPIIKIDKDIKLDGTKRNTNSNVEENSSQDTGNVNTEDFDGIKGDDFNYLRGVTISDDHDILTKENVEVKWNDKFVDDTKDYSANEESALTDNADGEFTLAGNGVKVYGEQRVGDNLLYYKVTDSWGRVSYAQRKNIILKNGIFQNKIKFEHQNGGNNLTLNFNKVENSAESDGKVQLNLINNNNNYFASSNADFKYYEIQVWVPDNNSSNEINSGYRNERTLTLKGNQTPGSVQSQINNFNNLQVPYGTILKIYAGHPQLFSIEGPVRNAAEDYSDKVQNPENVVDTVFKITDAGLKAIYVKTEVDKSLRENENLISLVAPEKIPLKIKISPNGSAGSSSNGGSISIVDSNTTWIDSSVEDVVFKMILKHENGQVVKEISISGKDYGDAQSISNQFRDFNYVYGDTLTISHRTPKKVLIKGNIINAREDYSDGVDNSLNLTEAVFKLTPTGLEAVYRSAPQIMGMIDIEVEKGKSIDYEQLKQSVSAKDNIDGFIPKENIQFSAETIDTSIVGMYEFTYTVTNSNQRTTTKSSTITVYDKPTITANSKATIELNSIENTEKAIKDYLKTAVDVNDDDDKLYNKTTKIEVKSTNVNPNNEGRYQATYVATDLYGYSKEETIDIEVVRTINVTVPTKLPFQVITNLIPNENGVQENDGFVSGVLKLKNNNTSPVKVSIESFVKKDGSGELEIVDPEVYDWNNMTIEDSMTKMALGIYVKDNSLTGSDYNDIEDSLWLSSEQHYNTITSDETNTRTGEEANGGSDTDQIGIINKQLGILPAKVTGSTTPAEASIGFTSKHGKNFKGGSVTGKFQLVFKFE
ncbi:immunoglobulin-like domain-containing protein [uncultured Clostridium sp.]|uniref:immunoglobulin-like domain-containing protein n=1 Tax=uncultured Clostridium sp. TaxID=59620 RepID=UPI00280B627F|nr:hypothetical protein [uncultured Clostridium sp.]